MATKVNVDNFARAESDRMFGDLQRDAGGVNTLSHNREPAAVDRQTVIRLNRDTLYSFAVVDISEGATVTVPEHGDRYLSVMVVNQDHYVTAIHHSAGEHQLTLARGLSSFDRTFGTRDEVTPVRHLIGTAAGWGGLPTYEATYVGVTPTLPPGDYELTVRDVPVDGFWSISVYNARGFFEPNDSGTYTVNSVTGVKNDDGSVTVRFSSNADAAGPNTIPTPEGWNYVVRLYRPRPEILDGSWSFPSITT